MAMLMGVQGAGKTIFYTRRFLDNVRISLDLMKTRHREWKASIYRGAAECAEITPRKPRKIFTADTEKT